MEDRNLTRFAVGCVAFLAIASVTVFTGFGFVLYGLSSGRLAATSALPQSKIRPRQLEDIGEIVGLRPTENVLYFYSASMTVSGDGNLFTNERVISYTSDSKSHQVFDAPYNEIVDFAFTPSTSWSDDSIISITLQDGTMFDLWVGPESGRDKAFYERLIQEWKRNRDADRGATDQ